MANAKIEFIFSEKDLDKAILAHSRASGTLKVKAVQLAYSVAVHVLVHGEASRLQKLVSASTYGKRIEKWALHHLPILKNEDKKSVHAYVIKQKTPLLDQSIATDHVSKWADVFTWKPAPVVETVTGEKAINAALNQAKKMPEGDAIRVALFAVADMIRQGENPVAIIHSLQSEVEHLKAQLAAATAAQTKPATKTRTRAKATA